MTTTPRRTTKGKRTVTHRVSKPTEMNEQSQAAVTEEINSPLGESTQDIPEPAPVPKGLKPRVPIGQRRPMAISETLDPNFEYRHVRGNPLNLQRYIDAGYEFVDGGIEVGDHGLMRGTRPDSRVSIPSQDSNDRLYLMRLPKELYDDDQKAKQREVDRTEEALYPDARNRGLEGKIDISR